MIGALLAAEAATALLLVAFVWLTFKALVDVHARLETFEERVRDLEDEADGGSDAPH